MFNSYIIKIFLISIVLYLLLFYFIYEIYRQKKINLDSRYLKKIKKRLNKLDRKYIKSTGINKKIKILNVYNILLVEFVLFIIFFKFNLKSTGNIVVALTFSVLISLMPIIVLDIYKKYLDMKIRKQLVNFISTMNRWCQVKEDIFFCFEKTYLTKIGNPLNRYIFEFLTQVNMGMDIADALKILEMKFDNDIFRLFIVNIRQVVKSRGNLIRLLSGLEEEAYKLEEEFNRRKLTLFKDKVMIYLIMFLVIFVYYYLINNNVTVKNFYLNTILGNILILIYSIIFFIGFIMALSLGKFEY